MADQGPIDVNALIAQIEAEGASKSDSSKPDPKVNLPAGLHLDPTGGVINIFGLDNRIPSGFVTYVYDAKDNFVGAVSHGIYTPLKEESQAPTQSIPSKPSKSQNQKTEPDQGKIVSFKYAQALQPTAEQEYQDMMVQADIIKRGNASPEQKSDFERIAKQYQSTISVIKSSYEKSGAVQGGNINLDTTGKLVQGTTYTDPSKPSAPAQTITPTGTTAVAPSTLKYGPNGESLVPGTAAYNAGSTTKPVPGVFQNPATAVPAATAAAAKTGKNALPTSALDANGNLITGKFTTKNGVLTQNGQAFTGQYNNQYYAAGKIETPEQVKQDFMDKYAVQAAFLASVPEFAQKGGLLDQAIAGNWSASKWKQAYQSSQWFQTNGATYATEEQDRLTAPGTYAANYNNLLDQMALTAKAEGIDISGFGGHITADQAKAMDPNSNPVAKLLQNYYTSAVPSNVLTTYLAKNGQIAMANGSAQGTLATTATSLRNYASQMGVASQFLSPTWSNAAGQQVAGSDYFTSAALAAEQGLTTADSVQANMRNVAANIYKPFAQQIKDGYSVSDLASPYTSAVANLLEVSPTSVDLGATTGYGSLVTKALQGDGTNPMNLDAFTTQVKQQPQWLNTKNARDSLMGTASTMLRNFGLVVGQ